MKKALATLFFVAFAGTISGNVAIAAQEKIGHVPVAPPNAAPSAAAGASAPSEGSAGQPAASAPANPAEAQRLKETLKKLQNHYKNTNSFSAKFKEELFAVSGS